METLLEQQHQTYSNGVQECNEMLASRTGYKSFFQWHFLITTQHTMYITYTHHWHRHLTVLHLLPQSWTLYNSSWNLCHTADTQSNLW